MLNTDAFILDTIFDTLPSGMMLFEPDGRIIRINQKAKEILGLDRDDKPAALDKFPYYLSPFSVLLQQSSQNVHRGESALQLPTRDEESTIGFSLQLMETPEGKTVKILTFSDITQVLKDRLAMDKIKDELNQSKKLASIGTMIAGVAHELNNPLTGISMSTSLVRLNLERLKKFPSVEADPKLQENLDKTLSEIQKVSRANEKAAVLVSDLLAYSKPSQLNLVPMPLFEMMSEFVNALKSHPQFSQFSFKLDDRTERWIMADRVKLEQVFYNLAKNACDATEGKGLLTLFFSESEEGGKPFVTVHVKDNGPGIDKTIISRIFDPFFTTKGHSGVGLGLSICYRTVEQHGGLLSVDSVKWEGTEFTVTLPIYLEEE
jgi:signal transduction histidine kinase